MISFTFINYGILEVLYFGTSKNSTGLCGAGHFQRLATEGLGLSLSAVGRSWMFMADPEWAEASRVFTERKKFPSKHSICIFYLVPYHAIMPYPIFGELRIRVEFTGSHFKGNQQCPSWYPLVVQVLRWFLSNRSRIQKCSHSLTDWDSTNEILGYRTTITVFAPIERTIDASWISTCACDFQVFFDGLKDSPQGVGHPRQWIINTRRSRARTKSWGTIGRTTALLAVPRCSVLTCITHPPNHPNLWTMHHTVHILLSTSITGVFWPRHA